jgi:hypothetical protein
LLWKKPGRQKSRPPGGGAAGRAQQFEFQRDISKQGSESEAPKVSSKTNSSKKQTKKKRSVKS